VFPQSLNGALSQTAAMRPSPSVRYATTGEIGRHIPYLLSELWFVSPELPELVNRTRLSMTQIGLFGKSISSEMNQKGATAISVNSGAMPWASRTGDSVVRCKRVGRSGCCSREAGYVDRSILGSRIL